MSSTVQHSPIFEVVRQQLLTRPMVMGILNLTPNSFSDGGRYASSEAAISNAHEMIRDGADIIDVGGESTRPGSQPVPAAEQWNRIGDAVTTLSKAGLAISVDTRSADVARKALEAGAIIVNDVSAGTDDEAMFDTVADGGAGIVLMHKQGESKNMQRNPIYEDCVGEVTDYLLARAEAATAAGVLAEKVWIDPGVGFGKTTEHSLELLRNMSPLVALGYPVLLGVSRKSFIDRVAGADVSARLGGSLAALVPALKAGVRGVRVHDVHATRQFLDILGVLEAAP